MKTATDQERASSFAMFFAEWHGPGLRLAARLCRDGHEAEDLVAESFTKMWAQWRTRPIDNPWGYLCRTIRNTAIDRYRRTDAEQARLRLAARDEPIRIEEPVEARILITQLMPGIPDSQQRAVMARYLLDLSEADAATALGIAPGTVKSSLARGLEKLRRFERTEMAA